MIAHLRSTYLLEIGKQVVPIPAIVTELAPCIVVRLGSTVITHTIHDGAASKDFACIGHEGLILKIPLRSAVDLEHVRVIVSCAIMRPQSLG